MTFFLDLLIGLFAIAAAAALVRGLKAFFDDGEQIRQKASGPKRGESQEAFGVKQNRMMTQRVLFQGIAVLLVALIGALASKA